MSYQASLAAGWLEPAPRP